MEPPQNQCCKRDSGSGKHSIDCRRPKQFCPSDNCVNLLPVCPAWDVDEIVRYDHDKLQRDEARENGFYFAGPVHARIIDSLRVPEVRSSGETKLPGRQRRRAVAPVGGDRDWLRIAQHSCAGPNWIGT